MTVHEFTPAFAPVTGANLAYEDTGHGVPLVLMHAGVCDSRMWDEHGSVFSQFFRTIRFDARGFGRSPMPDGTFAYRDDLYGILMHLGVNRSVILGVSYAGAVAIDFTLEHPDMVTALIVVASGVSGQTGATEAEQQRYQEMEAAENEGDIDRLNDLEVRMWADGLYRTPEQVNSTVRERMREMNLDSLKLQNPKAVSRRMEPPAIDQLQAIQVPTLVIVGDLDTPSVVATADLLARRISGAKKVVMHGVAHVPNMEQPEDFTRHILEFLQNI